MRILASESNVISMILALGIALAATEAAKSQDREEDLDRGTEKLDVVGPLPDDRPTRIGDRLIWRDHALAGLCRELGGAFRKLAGRPEYMCRLPATGGAVRRLEQRGSE
jgi:hypothetical protein